jgi:hypothetical protein
MLGSYCTALFLQFPLRALHFSCYTFCIVEDDPLMALITLITDEMIDSGAPLDVVNVVLGLCVLALLVLIVVVAAREAMYWLHYRSSALQRTDMLAAMLSNFGVALNSSSEAVEDEEALPRNV